MSTITCIEDARTLYRQRVPKLFYDYCESGSYTEGTFRSNTDDFKAIHFRQRIARDLSNRVISSKMLGGKVTIPVGLSPVGSAGMQCADGEIKAARAAAKFGVPFTLSTMSICSIEDVRAESPEPFWFQLYVMRDEAFVDSLIDRAKRAHCSALVLTLDLQVVGQRHKDLKNGLSYPPRLTLPNLINIMTKPSWAFGMARTKRRTFRNVVGHAKGVGNLASLNEWANEQFEPKLDWAMVARIRDKWGGKFVLKGILDPEDARMAIDAGADAVVVSNHGGRQLDGALSTIRMLPEIVKAVGGRAEVWLDSGIRSGQDVLKALALGANSTMIGRAYVYGLGAQGEAGVTTVLNTIRKEIDITLALCGERDISNFSRDNIYIGHRIHTEP